MDVQLYDVSDKDKRSPAGWETGSGTDELRLVEYDLFNVRRIKS